MAQLCNFAIWRNLWIDHIIPLTSGGDESGENKAVACSVCNQVKGKYLPTGNNREERLAGARHMLNRVTMRGGNVS